MQNGDKTTITRESRWWLIYIKGAPVEVAENELKLSENQLWKTILTRKHYVDCVEYISQINGLFTRPPGFSRKPWSICHVKSINKYRSWSNNLHVKKITFVFSIRLYRILHRKKLQMIKRCYVIPIYVLKLHI